MAEPPEQLTHVTCCCLKSCRQSREPDRDLQQKVRTDGMSQGGRGRGWVMGDTAVLVVVPPLHLPTGLKPVPG